MSDNTNDQPLRVLLSELGNYAAGDEALYVAATRRLLAAGHGVQWLSRLSFQHTIAHAAFPIRETMIPVDPRPLQGIGDRKTLLQTFQKHAPDAWERLNELLEGHDVLLVAPGGKFVDGYSVPRVLLAAAAAQTRGIPVIVLHQTFGPLVKPHDLALLGEVLADCELVILRDDCSRELIDGFYLPAGKCAMARDLIFAEEYACDPDRIDYDLGINFRLGFNGHIDPDILSAFIQTYQREFPGHRILWYTTTHALTDEVVSEARRLGCDIQPELPVYPDYLTWPARCRLNITDSFHGAIFSMLADRFVLIAQPDFASYKFQGSSVPGYPTWEPMRGLMAATDISMLMNAIRKIMDHPEQHAEFRKRLLDFGRTQALTGWSQVEDTLDRIAVRLHGASS